MAYWIPSTSRTWKLFIDNDLSLEDGDNNVIIREDIIAQLETAQKIRDIFFSKQNGLGASFAVETVSLSGNKRRSVLNLDGQLVDYSGAVTIPPIWSGLTTCAKATKVS